MEEDGRVTGSIDFKAQWQEHASLMQLSELASTAHPLVCFCLRVAKTQLVNVVLCIYISCPIVIHFRKAVAEVMTKRHAQPRC